MYINEGQGEGPSVSRTDPTRLTTRLPITSTVFDRQGCQKREKPQTDRKPWVVGNRVVTICYSFLCLIRNDIRLDIDTITDTIIRFSDTCHLLENISNCEGVDNYISTLQVRVYSLFMSHCNAYGLFMRYNGIILISIN